MSVKIVIREGVEFIVDETAIRFEIYTPQYSELSPVTVYKPAGVRPAQVSWFSVGVATPQQAREVGLALILGADMADTLNRGAIN